MKTREQLEKEYQEALEALKAQEAIAATLPDCGIPVFLIHRPASPVPCVSYQASTLEQALQVFDVYAPHIVPWSVGRANSFRVEQPREIMKPEYAESPEASAAEYPAPALRMHAGEQFQSARFEFWARIAGRLLEINVSADHYRGNAGNFGFWIQCQRREAFGRSYVVPGTWQPPRDLKADHVNKWGGTGGDSADYTLRWNSIESFRAEFGRHIEARRKARADAAERARLEYQKRRNPAKLAELARLVLDTLNRSDVSDQFDAIDIADGWTLRTIQAIGYRKIQAAVQKTAPEVLSKGLHDFLNSLYYLADNGSADEYSGPYYRDDMRAVYEAVRKGEAVQ